MFRQTAFLSALLIGALTSSMRSQGTQSPKTIPFGTIKGIVFDSIHATPLTGALVMVDGMANSGRSNANGEYRIDSVPAGSRRLIVSHPLLDTIGFVVASPEFPVVPTGITTMDLATPAAPRIISAICRDARGPAAVMGQVRDASSDDPATGARVQLVYEEGDPLGFRKVPVVREATVDASGGYAMCGLPAPLSAKVQVFRGGVSSGEVAVSIGPEGLGLRSFSIASATAVMRSDTASTKPLYRGLARISGRVVNTDGFAIQGGRVTIAGSGTTALTNARGEFRIDSLPPGTQSLEVRKLGYAVAEQGVELTDGVEARADVTMSTYELAPVTIEADRETALARIGYTERKRAMSGYFLDGDRIRGTAPHFTDIIRGATALKFMPTRDGHTAVVSSRDPNAGCVNFTVDGTHWKELKKGDIDDFVRPDEVRAIEVYNPENTPARFEVGGQTSCVTVVVWTVRGTNKGRRK